MKGSTSQLNFEKMNGLIPAVIQDVSTLKVLMVGFMNEEALSKTIDTGKVTFFSRTKNRLWTKGEESGNFLTVVELLADCDDDTILVKADPAGPVCHTGADTCFFEENKGRGIGFITYLQDLIDRRKKEMPENSYTTSLFQKGTAAIAQKVGEEAVETLIGSLTGDNENFIYESADLLYHLIVLLSEKGFRIEDVAEELKKRHK
ncbi:MAG: bifunctional phosphoribosyl-AMP cyclohydrolase/phosphoribosyl-ATP diphosphatase HisIE [Prolixibacteraceae bacterium]|jgi:phosphoribosyl-ATP pyrophosphohydrolase/phosphoribosyl-AMP cyclohydrolase|nr:bifunctional phosphoribosyl-AMP cyclohydrolase/phosphoribosyl-ATP diphosphatase HisIE [Prolixibacteraceae bacterium]MDD4755017.1 bifunctional phosphoribosyl-AMP cyclohydrolase/phosphoribosyl-ATP diphosphatase HisIE [Prolixibacteraceae bacterium]NLO02977.1 bifunctional phosphoribosyl-AMP cyclohydrolase/phosphoribosyl-ATP diphosphatase HisIE [Bacteroidales bacterium]